MSASRPRSASTSATPLRPAITARAVPSTPDASIAAETSWRTPAPPPARCPGSAAAARGWWRRSGTPGRRGRPRSTAPRDGRHAPQRRRSRGRGRGPHVALGHRGQNGPVVHGSPPSSRRKGDTRGRVPLPRRTRLARNQARNCADRFSGRSEELDAVAGGAGAAGTRLVDAVDEALASAPGMRPEADHPRLVAAEAARRRPGSPRARGTGSGTRHCAGRCRAGPAIMLAPPKTLARRRARIAPSRTSASISRSISEAPWLATRLQTPARSGRTMWFMPPTRAPGSQRQAETQEPRTVPSTRSGSRPTAWVPWTDVDRRALTSRVRHAASFIRPQAARVGGRRCRRGRRPWRRRRSRGRRAACRRRRRCGRSAPASSPGLAQPREPLGAVAAHAGQDRGDDASGRAARRCRRACRCRACAGGVPSSRTRRTTGLPAGETGRCCPPPGASRIVPASTASPCVASRTAGRSVSFEALGKAREERRRHVLRDERRRAVRGKAREHPLERVDAAGRAADEQEPLPFGR